MNKLNLKLYPIEKCPNFDSLSDKFDSTNEQINKFFKTNCLKYSKENRLQTFVLIDPSTNVMVGFFSSTVGVLNQSIKEDNGSQIYSLPYINLAYFAIDKQYQSQGIGRALMIQFFSMCMVISQYTGIFYIYLEAVTDSVNFYKKLGYHLEDERKNPEVYEKYQSISKVDLSKITFPMIMPISNLRISGYKAYSKNSLPIDLIF